jgi:TonB family protein
MNARSFSLIVLIACVWLPKSLCALESAAYLGSTGTRAVDAKGVRHNGADYPRKHPPWLDDTITTVAPEYTYSDRAQRHQGVGWFQLTLDLKTGAVTNISIIKSTGFRSLDNCAIKAFRNWRWKSGKWKLVEMPVTFRLGNPSAPPPRGATHLPAS